MSISERIEKTVEKWRKLWGDALSTFLATIIVKGTIKLLDALEEEASPSAKDYLTRFPMPPEMKEELEAFTATKSAIHLPVWALMAISMVAGSLIGSIMGWAAPIGRWTSYIGEKLLKTTRLDPSAVITAWRRDKVTYEKFFDDLKDQGWSDERIEALKFYSLVYPSPRDLVEFQAHEVFEPDMIAKYGLDAEVGELERERFYEIGMSDEIIEEYWRNHWVHPAWGQVLDMYHRGVITYDDIESWFRLVEIPPYWRAKLIEISWDLPNRIETRMMARYGLVDKPWLVGHLERIGLHEDYRSIAADFMLAMGIRMDVSARFSKGWLTADQVKSEIAAFGMSEDINDRLYKWIVKNVGPERVESERGLTKTEIYAGVKKGVISWTEGIELLMDLGYSSEDAQYILEVRVGALAGSPETFTEFKEWTQSYRRAQGLEYHIPPRELVEAEVALREAEKALGEAEEKKGKGKASPELYKAVSDATYRYRQLLAKWKAEGSSTK